MKKTFLLLALAALAWSCTSDNLARFRTVTASSAYDYNLTAQLACDGIVENGEPARLTVLTPDGEIPRIEKEHALDRTPHFFNRLNGEETYIDYQWTGFGFSTPCVRIAGKVVYDGKLAEGTSWKVRCLAGEGLECIAEESGMGLIGEPAGSERFSDPNKNDREVVGQARRFCLEMPVSVQDISRFRVEFSMPGAVYWKITTVEFAPAEGFGHTPGNGNYRSKDDYGIDVLPSQVFSSSWMSSNADPQWICVDLGSRKTLTKLVFHWIHGCEAGSIQFSYNGRVWRNVASLRSMAEGSCSVPVRGKCRFVRVNMEGADESGHFCLSELEVWGRELALGKKKADGWRLRRDSQEELDGTCISEPGFDASGWLPAIVPGTVLYSYIAAGAVPDPSVSDNNQQISESYFNSGFWYRGIVDAPEPYSEGTRSLLEFDGINFMADVYMNGVHLGEIAGAFRQKAFDVTDIVRDKNVVAVHILPGSHPGATKEKTAEWPGYNGGMTGADSPSFQASVGWDWIPTVRGREAGIWNDVRIRRAKDCDVCHPMVLSRVSPSGKASVTAGADIVNLAAEPVKGVLRGGIGDISFEKEVEVPAGATVTEVFTPEAFPQLSECGLALWWPNGMGEPVLHKAWFDFVPDGLDGGRTHDIEYSAGIREFTYEDIDTALKMYVNGHRFIPKGGNWGFSEINLRYREAEYEKAVSLHDEMNFNMIRNWVGQTGDDEFYQACDRHGIVVWQDFWLANPCDGPDPDDEVLFMDNADDYVRRIRSHASIGLYCGRNEGYPPAALNAALDSTVRTLHPGIVYIASSADEGVSGHGPYKAVNADWYFANPTLKFHSERGMPAIPNIESLKKIFGKEHIWPFDDVWGQHDFTRTGAQGDMTFVNMVRSSFGESAMEDAEAFARYAQWINYDGYRAMYEANNVDRHGLLIWMSHSCWPSLAWQTYDYWFDLNGAFWGAQKACETLHPQFNPSSMTIQVVNTSAAAASGLSVQLSLVDCNGNQVYSKTASGMDVPEDSTLDAIDCADVPDGLCLMYLTLSDCDGKVLSENVYLKNFREGVNTGDYTAMPSSTLDMLFKRTMNL